MIKKVLSYGIIMVMLLGLLTSSVYAASNDKVFYGAGIDHNDGNDRAWWVHSLDNDGILGTIKNNNGYSGYEVSEDAKASYALRALKERAGIFAVHTHGSSTAVDFSSNTSIYKSDIDALTSNALKHVDIVVYGTCQAAKGGDKADNIVNSTFKKGANVVIGFEGDTFVNQMNQWLYDFFKSYSKGNNVTKSAEDGLYWAKFWNFGDPGGTDTVLIRQ